MFFLAAMGSGSVRWSTAGDGITGVGYVAFIAPGILWPRRDADGVIESTYPVMGAVKWQRQYHAMLATPLGPYDIVLGHLAFILIRVVITSAAFLLVTWALGAIGSPWAVLALPVAALSGMAHAAPIFAFAVRQEIDGGFAMLFRFVILPMFLFSGVLPRRPAAVHWLELVAYVTPLWHGVDLCRSLALGTATPAAPGPRRYLLLWVVGGCGWPCAPSGEGWSDDRHRCSRRAAVGPRHAGRALPLTPARCRRRGTLVERNARACTGDRGSSWSPASSSRCSTCSRIGVGVGRWSATSRCRRRRSRTPPSSRRRCWPAAMNGAIFDSTYNVFFKLKYAKLYDSVLATPLGPRPTSPSARSPGP